MKKVEVLVDEIRMRSKSIAAGIPITTTIAGAEAAVDGLRDQLEFGRFEVSCLQEYLRHIHQSARA